MIRRHNWEQLMHSAIEGSGVYRMPGNDCFAFVVRVVQAITGEDISDGILERYSTEAEADALIKEEGGLTVWLTAHLGPPIKATLARRGDVVMLRYTRDGVQREAVGIAVSHRAAFITSRGVQLARLDHCHAAWSIDHAEARRG